jgi:hypothetical protein
MLQPRQTGAPGVRSSVKKQGDDPRQGGVNQSALTKRKGAKRKPPCRSRKSSPGMKIAKDTKSTSRHEDATMCKLRVPGKTLFRQRNLHVSTPLHARVAQAAAASVLSAMASRRSTAAASSSPIEKAPALSLGAAKPPCEKHTATQTRCQEKGRPKAA